MFLVYIYYIADDLLHKSVMMCELCFSHWIRRAVEICWHFYKGDTVNYEVFMSYLNHFTFCEDFSGIGKPLKSGLNFRLSEHSYKVFL